MNTNIITDPERIDAVLTRGVSEVIGIDRLRERMLAGEQLRIKLGIDPTSPHIHLGRSITLLKLRDFQELGHQVVFIIGSFTAQVGDTSDKDSERPMLAAEAVQANLSTYLDQAGKIIDISQTEFHYNHEWLEPLSFGKISVLCDEFSVNEFISRDVIDRRISAGKRVSLREMLYPLMQGYDSVMVRADVEIGGTDQRFNCLAGRTLQKAMGQEPQSIIVGPIIAGTDGAKMSSSKGNVVKIDHSPADMFGLLMSVHDDLIIEYMMTLTREPVERIAVMQHQLNSGGNPRDIKMAMAHTLVAQYHGLDEARRSQDGWIAQFTNDQLPEHIPDITPSSHDIITVLVESELVSSKTEARRMIEQGAVRVNQTQVRDVEYVVVPGDVVSRGKLHFVRVI
jgi:tyrosyl-tRNA synthetase